MKESAERAKGVSLCELLSKAMNVQKQTAECLVSTVQEVKSVPSIGVVTLGKMG